MPDPTPLRARYIGYTKGTENHGDEALIWIIRDLLAPDIEVTSDAEEADIALLGGGTLINQSPWLIDEFARQMECSSHGIVFGTGVGDTLFWGSHFDRWIPLLRRCSHVGVRGPCSHLLLVEHGLPEAEMIGDPYLALRAPMENVPVPMRIAINVGRTNNALFGGDEDGFLRAVNDLAGLLRSRGWSVIWVSVWSRDLEILQSLRAGDELLLDARSDSLEALSAVSGCDLFLGEKLHALAMSAVAGTPFIAWEYQPKVRDFAASVGMEEHVVSTAERVPEGMADRLESLRSRRQAVSMELERQTALRRAAIIAFADRVRQWARERSG